jgi:hypothetical protein
MGKFGLFALNCTSSQPANSNEKQQKAAAAREQLGQLLFLEEWLTHHYWAHRVRQAHFVSLHPF